MAPSESVVYAWCWSHGRDHRFTGDPWCTARWTPLPGTTRAKTLAAKTEQYGDAEFLHHLPDTKQLATLLNHRQPRPAALPPFPGGVHHRSLPRPPSRTADEIRKGRSRREWPGPQAGHRDRSRPCGAGQMPVPVMNCRSAAGRSSSVRTAPAGGWNAFTDCPYREKTTLKNSPPPVPSTLYTTGPASVM